MSKKRKFLATFVFACLASVLFGQSFTVFDVPQSLGTYPTGINSAGQITGSFYNSSNARYGFLRKANGKFATFHVSGSTGTFATGISANGQVIGYSYGPVRKLSRIAEDSIRGFMRQPNGGIKLFDACSWRRSVLPETNMTYPQAINDSGFVAGNCTQDIYIDSYAYGFTRTPNGVLSPLTPPNDDSLGVVAVNSLGQITGWTANPAGGPLWGFVVNADGSYLVFSVDPSGPTWTLPAAINSSGQITGVYTDAQHNDQAFLRDPDGTFTFFNVENSTLTQPVAISSHGEIAGYWTDSNGNNHGFVQDTGGNITTFDVPGASSTTPAALSNNVLTGTYSDANGGNHGFLVNIGQLRH